MTKSKINSIFITGASATGKNTIVNEIVKQNKDIYKLLIDTTRPPRIGEEDGIDYNFLSQKQYLHNYNNNLYYGNDWTNEFNNYFYGTPKTRADFIKNRNCIGMPTCVDVAKEIINSDYLLQERIKWVHLITNKKTKYERLQKRGASSQEIFFRLYRGDTHNTENMADINIDTGLSSIKDILEEIFSIL